MEPHATKKPAQERVLEPEPARVPAAQVQGAARDQEAAQGLGVDQVQAAVAAQDLAQGLGRAAVFVRRVFIWDTTV
jgi:hypothetical protein